MGTLDIRFHGICTHLYQFNESGVPHRVVLLQCDSHRPLLEVPCDATVHSSGNGSCNCVEELFRNKGDRMFRLDGVRLSMPGSRNGLHGGPHWPCGIPQLKSMYPPLELSDEKVRSYPPVGVSAWVDVSNGKLEPYVSCKGAVAVQLMTDFAEDRPKIEACCWREECPDVTWTFELPSGSRVRISNDCGRTGNASDFLMHFQINKHRLVGVRTLQKVPDCLESSPPPSPQPDWPPQWEGGNASLGCSNSGYP